MALIRRVAAALQASVGHTHAVAAEAGAYRDLGLDTIADHETDRGPLGGLYAALTHRQTTYGEGWLLLTACDWINADPAWLNPLTSRTTQERTNAGAVAYHAERWEPMPGLYHTDILETVDARLRDSERSLWRLLETLGAESVPIPPELGGLRQANTPQDLQERG